MNWHQFFIAASGAILQFFKRNSVSQWRKLTDTVLHTYSDDWRQGSAFVVNGKEMTRCSVTSRSRISLR